VIDRRNDIYKILNLKNYKLGIEVGTFEGDFSRTILSTWNGTLYSLDIWKTLDNEEYVDTSNNITPFDTLGKTIINIEGFEDRSVLIRTSSENGSKIFPNEYFDFVYIDANHKYSYVKQDIELWYPKIKHGGMISGHDYINDYKPDQTVNGYDTNVWIDNNFCGLFGVNPAVDEFVKKYNLDLNITSEYFGTWYTFKK